MCPTTVLVADDRDIVRAGLVAILERQESLQLVGEARSTEDALLQARLSCPQVVVVASELPTAGGLTLCRQIKESVPCARTLIVGLPAQAEEAIPAVAAGASGYLLATADRDRLLLAVRAVARGETFLDPTVTGPVVGRLIGLLGGANRVEPLSVRELEVLALLASGDTNKQIALRLSVSETTVKTHVSHILNKLGVERRVDAARQAVRLGLDRTA